MSVYYMLKLRRAHFDHIGTSLSAWEGFDLTSEKGLSFLVPHRPEYYLEVFLPLLATTSSSKSETVKALTSETLQLLIFLC